MSAEIMIAKARVIGVEEITIKPPAPKVSLADPDPYDYDNDEPLKSANQAASQNYTALGALGGLAGYSANSLAGSSPSPLAMMKQTLKADIAVALKPKTMIVSRLKITAAGPSQGYTTVEGLMTYPGELPFGAVYDMVLRPEADPTNINGRLFKDGEQDQGEL